MAKPTITEVLDRLSQSEQRNAAMFASIFEGMTTLAEAVKPKADHQIVTTPTEAASKDEPKATEAPAQGGDVVTGKIKRLAWHKAGLLLEGNATWFNAAKGSKFFEGSKVGDEVTLVLDGDIVTSFNGKTVAPDPAPKEVARTESKATEGGCEFCKGAAHRHVSTIAVQAECLNRQYQAAGYEPVNFKNPALVTDLLRWMATVNAKFAGMGAASAASTSQTEAPKEQKQDAPKEQRRYNGPRRRSSGQPKAEEALAENLTGGTYKGFINRIGQTEQTKHMVRIISGTHNGPKGEGVWFSATPELLAGRSVGDRVSYVLDGRDKNLGKLIGLTLLGSVEKDTGHKAGVENSGKQQAPAPKGQPKDEVAASGKEGAEAKAAKVAARRAAMAAANKSAA